MESSPRGGAALGARATEARRGVAGGRLQGMEACLFDLDGVLTDTAHMHERAWRVTFDSAGLGPFTHDDYIQHVDGRARVDGIRALLDARGSAEPDGAFVSQLAEDKTRAFLADVAAHGVRPLPGAAAFVAAVRAAGTACAVVTSSANCSAVLAAAGLAGQFDAAVDGVLRKERGLRGKPAPDTFLAGSAMLGVPPRKAAVFEDALAGVQAGRDGGFGLVVGVSSAGDVDALRAHGADVVVRDLSELLS